MKRKRIPVRPEDLAELARKAREQAKKTKTEAASELGVSWTLIHLAETKPKKNYSKVRIQMLELYAGQTVEGPEYFLVNLPPKP